MSSIDTEVIRTHELALQRSVTVWIVTGLFFMQTVHRIWEKLIWTWRPQTGREAGDSVVRNLLLHWFPAKVTLGSLSFRYSFWLGTISAVLFALLTLTGMNRFWSDSLKRPGSSRVSSIRTSFRSTPVESTTACRG